MMKPHQPSGGWLRRTHPFPHILGESVFSDAVYQRLVCGARGALREAEEGGGPRRMPNYGADIVSLTAASRTTVPILLERDWHDRLGAALGMEHSGEIDAGVHRHSVGSPTGWVHNDFNPAYFQEASRHGQAVISDRARCDYKTGACLSPGIAPIERMRAALMIYYLDSEWQPGCGGETGLYSHARQPPDEPDVRVPPRNNSMLLFECTPHSYHSFVTNTQHVAGKHVLKWPSMALPKIAGQDLGKVHSKRLQLRSTVRPSITGAVEPVSVLKKKVW
jgi:hypothetical protein